MEPSHDDIAELQKKLLIARSRLGQLAPRVALARVVKETFKRDLDDTMAALQLEFVKRGERISTSHFMARADARYIEKKKILVDGLTSAYQVLSEWEALQGAVDIGRSLLAMNRESMRNLEG